MKKKILIISLFYFPYVGGAEVALKELFKHFDNKKYSIELITTRIDRKNKKEEYIGNIKVIRVGIGNKLFDKLFFPFFALIKSFFLSFDIIFSSQMNHAGVATTLISFFKKRPVIMNVQDGFKESEVRKKLGFLYFLYSMNYNKFFYYQCISNDLVKRVKKYGVDSSHIELISNGVDLDIFNVDFSREEIRDFKKKLNFKSTQKILITTSRLSQKNALDDVIKSLRFLDTNITFLICGSGEDEIKLKELVKKLDLSERVKFVGSIPYSELPLYLSISDIFIRPSVYEGFGNSFIEAMAVNLPVIATPVGGIPDFLINRKTGLFVKVRNPKDIADKVNLLLNDKKLSKEIVLNARSMVFNNYSWKDKSFETEKFIERLTLK